ncbi:hypothetical protein PLICBS_004076 [Purpureocillium lilacinum]|uniref:uncharacterized protein n=1 Tax=Purpureocillium lilacinum TaxID=33203 RepID=UPI00208455E1|nr:hypothetical protein PLICBS_004076 [Purpureocillium lilacinum]
MAQDTRAEVIVIGAGVSGLTAASELQREGIDVIVLEACPTIGGRAKSTTTRLGLHIDLRGQWIGHGHRRLTALIERAGGTMYKTLTRGLPLIVRDRRTVSIFSPSALVSLLYLAIVEVMSKVYVPRRWVALTVDKAIETMAPTQLARQLLQLLVAVTSTADLANFSMYSYAKTIPLCGGLIDMTSTAGGAQDSLIVESTGIATSMLAGELSREVLTDTIVTSVSQDESEGVKVGTASGRQFHASKVIVTVPPPMWKNIKFEPALPAERRALQRNTRMGIVYKAFAIYEEPFWRDGLGAEILVLDDPAFGVFDSTSPGGPGHLCILVPGSPAHQLNNLSAGEQRDFLLSRLVPHLGRRVLQPVDWHDKAWHLDEHCGGGYMAFPVTGSTEGILPMPHEPIGNLHWAGTETSTDHPGYIEGAIQSGERVAQEIVRDIRQVRNGEEL